MWNDCKTRKDTKYRTTKQGPNTKPNKLWEQQQTLNKQLQSHRLRTDSSRSLPLYLKQFRQGNFDSNSKNIYIICLGNVSFTQMKLVLLINTTRLFWYTTLTWHVLEMSVLPKEISLTHQHRHTILVYDSYMTCLRNVSFTQRNYFNSSTPPHYSDIWHLHDMS